MVKRIPVKDYTEFLVEQIDANGCVIRSDRDWGENHTHVFVGFVRGHPQVGELELGSPGSGCFRHFPALVRVTRLADGATKKWLVDEKSPSYYQRLERYWKRSELTAAPAPYWHMQEYWA